MVKWPGSALWYPAKILGMDGEEYKVKFEEGAEDEVTVDNIRVSNRIPHNFCTFALEMNFPKCCDGG